MKASRQVVLISSDFGCSGIACMVFALLQNFKSEKWLDDSIMELPSNEDAVVDSLIQFHNEEDTDPEIHPE